MGLIVDTDVLIHAERSLIPLSSLTDTLYERTGESVFALSVVTLAELAHSQKRTQDPGLTLRRQVFLNIVQDAFPVHVVNSEIAIRAGLLDGDLKSMRQNVGFADLLIASTALHYRYGVITFNLRDFQRVATLRVVDADEL